MRPTEIMSTPVAEYAAIVSSVMPPDTSSSVRRTWPALSFIASCDARRRDLVGRHVVQQDRVGTGRRGPRALVDTSRTRRAPFAPASGPAPRATASVMPMPPRWLSLISIQSDRLPRWLRPPPARTAAFASERSPGHGLARVPHPAVASFGGLRHECGGQRRDARQVPQEVQRGALAGEDRRQTARAPRRTPGPASTRRRRPPTRSPSTAGSTWAKVSVAHADAGEPAGLSGPRTGPRSRRSGSNDDVRSPSGLRSSARARWTASRTTWGGACSQDGSGVVHGAELARRRRFPKRAPTDAAGARRSRESRSASGCPGTRFCSARPRSGRDRSEPGFAPRPVPATASPVRCRGRPRRHAGVPAR